MWDFHKAWSSEQLFQNCLVHLLKSQILLEPLKLGFLVVSPKSLHFQVFHFFISSLLSLSFQVFHCQAIHEANKSGTLWSLKGSNIMVSCQTVQRDIVGNSCLTMYFSKHVLLKNLIHLFDRLWIRWRHYRKRCRLMLPDTVREY